ncbi:hypothetical protein SFMTTN_3429 [Sulfuriferula multivorans]|uniref:Uncharacterized protein n=1 Tax=Sulfuriferula multivorans TaxID=1559896 RepID=A0A401JHS2_9PROT|nr:hypothetical protein SFMTTN_3429 [Sulfuriferula multivorans]
MLDDIVGMLSGNARKLFAACAFCTMASHAGRNPFAGDAARENRLALALQFGISRLVGTGLLLGKIGSQFIDLRIGQAAGDAPHILEAGRILAMVTPELLQLRDQIPFLLSRQPWEGGVGRIASDAMAVRAHLLGQCLAVYAGVTQIAGGVFCRRAACSDRSQGQYQGNWGSFHDSISE